MVILDKWPVFQRGTASDPVSVSSSQTTVIISNVSTVAYSDSLPDLPSLPDSNESF